MADTAVKNVEIEQGTNSSSGFVLASRPAELDLAPYVEPRGQSLLEIAAGRAAALVPAPDSTTSDLPSLAVIGIGLAIGVTAGLLII